MGDNWVTCMGGCGMEGDRTPLLNRRNNCRTDEISCVSCSLKSFENNNGEETEEENNTYPQRHWEVGNGNLP